MGDNAMIVGYGEIGQALGQVLGPVHSFSMYDLKWGQQDVWGLDEPIDVLHICFPWSEGFVSGVREYQEHYRPRYTVIHSTVPMGTSAQVGAVHSPVIGMHPHLSKSMLAFTKFLGGPDAGAVADHFRSAGMRVYLTDKAETTEMLKLLCTTFYALCIEWTKEVKSLCDAEGLPFEMWTLWTEAYNHGYAVLGHAEYQRPNLVPIMKPLGGHCLTFNTQLWDSPFCDLINLRNEVERKGDAS